MEIGLCSYHSLRMSSGDCPGFRVVPQCKDWHPYGKISRHMHREEAHVKTSSVGMMLPQPRNDEDCHQPPDVGREACSRDFFKPPEATKLANTLISGFWSPEPVKE